MLPIPVQDGADAETDYNYRFDNEEWINILQLFILIGSG